MAVTIDPRNAAVGPLIDLQVTPWVANQTGPPTPNTANSVGPGIIDFKLEQKPKADAITSAALLGARIGTYLHSYEYVCSFKTDMFRQAAIAEAFGALNYNTGKDVIMQGIGGLSTDYSVYALPLTADGRQKAIWVPRMAIVAESAFEPGLKQHNLPWSLVPQFDPTATYTDGSNTVAGFTCATVDSPVVALTSLAAPTVSPINAASGVSTGVAPTFTWGVAIDAGTVKKSSFFIVRADNDAIIATATPTLDATSKIVTLTPSAPLTSGKTYYLVVTPGAVADTIGNVFAGQTTTFAT